MVAYIFKEILAIGCDNCGSLVCVLAFQSPPTSNFLPKDWKKFVFCQLMLCGWEDNK